MSDALLRRVRRLLLLLAATARAELKGKGVPLARAVTLAGCRSEAELLADVQAARGLWKHPASGDDAVDLYVEDGEVHLTYAQAFGTPPAFSLAEGAALLSVLGPLRASGDRALQGLVRKIRKAIPDALRPEAESLARGLDLEPPPAGPWAGALREAIADRVETVLEYRAIGDGAVAKRTVEPRLLFHRDAVWYLAAWNVDKREEHLYRVDRIVSVEVGTRRFGDHKGPDPARYGTRRLFFRSGTEREVKVRFSPSVAALVRSQWPSATANDDGSVTVAVTVTPGNYLYGWVLGYGGHANVESPPDVREQFQARVEDLRNLHARG
jgi:proteasome accessory factor C